MNRPDILAAQSTLNFFEMNGKRPVNQLDSQDVLLCTNLQKTFPAVGNYSSASTSSRVGTEVWAPLRVTEMAAAVLAK